MQGSSYARRCGTRLRRYPRSARTGLVEAPGDEHCVATPALSARTDQRKDEARPGAAEPGIPRHPRIVALEGLERFGCPRVEGTHETGLNLLCLLRRQALDLVKTFDETSLILESAVWDNAPIIQLRELAQPAVPGAPAREINSGE